MQKKVVKEFEDAKNGMCKIVGGAHNLILGEIMKEDAYEAECDSREQANPQRRCSFKGEVFRKHPKKFCTIQGIAVRFITTKKCENLFVELNVRQERYQIRKDLANGAMIY